VRTILRLFGLGVGCVENVMAGAGAWGRRCRCGKAEHGGSARPGASCNFFRTPNAPPMSESLARTDPAALPGRDLPAPATGTGTTPLALPHAATRLDRIQAQTETLVESVKEWAELRIKLTQTELEQKAQLKINQMVWARAVPLLLISLAAMFLLITIALGLGWLLGHTFWGFLIVTVALMSSAGGVAYFNRATLRNLSEEADVDLSITSHV